MELGATPCTMQQMSQYDSSPGDQSLVAMELAQSRSSKIDGANELRARVLWWVGSSANAIVPSALYEAF